MSLLRTLAFVTFVFVVCWLPYGLMIVIDPNGISDYLKKVCLNIRNI